MGNLNFNIRDLIWLTIAVALVLGLILEKTRRPKQVELLKSRLYERNEECVELTRALEDSQISLENMRKQRNWIWSVRNNSKFAD